jgi:hypothetical protein
MAMASSGKDGAEAVFDWMQAEYERIYEMTLGGTGTWWDRDTKPTLVFFGGVALAWGLWWM